MRIALVTVGLLPCITIVGFRSASLRVEYLTLAT
jgi:hypothetical protein